LLALGTKPVLADDTPTPTYVPFWETPTPEIFDKTCPDGQPTGWGVVTPSARWLLHCSNCVTPESGYDWNQITTPDYTPEATTTPEPTETPNPGDDVIGLFTNIYYPWWEESDPSTYPIDLEPEVEYYTDAHIGNLWGNNGGLTGFATQNIDYYYHVYHEGRGPAYAGWTQSLMVECKNGYHDGLARFVVNYPGGTHTTAWLGSGQSETVNIATWPTDLTNDQWYSFNIEVQYENRPKPAMFPQIYGGMTGDNNYYEVYITWHRGEYVPSGSSGGDSYCAEVESEGEDGSSEDDDFTLPGIGMGVANCYILGGFNIPLSWLDVFFPGSIDDVSIPSAEFCFIPLDFGNLNIFGITIDLDWIAAAMAAVVLFRLIVRS